MGQVFSGVCTNCGFKITGNIGVGFMFPIVYGEVRKRALDGEYGDEMMNFLRKNPQRAIDAEIDLFVCEECGDISSDYNLGMYIPREEDEEMLKEADFSSEDTGNSNYFMPDELRRKFKKFKDYDHRCEKCHGKLKIVVGKGYDKLKCPRCKYKLIPGDIIMWD